MVPVTTQSGSNRKRVVLIGLTLLGVVGGIIGAGLFFDRGRLRPISNGSDGPADLTDEESADYEAFRTMSEREEIELITNRSNFRLLKKSLPTFDPASFDRLMEFARHSNFALRFQAIQYLGMMGRRGKSEPYASDPTSLRQREEVLGLVETALQDSSPQVRGFAFRVFGLEKDNRFIDEARRALKSDFPSERAGAEEYFVYLAGGRAVK
jgi:hypothetical protein